MGFGRSGFLAWGRGGWGPINRAPCASHVMGGLREEPLKVMLGLGFGVEGLGCVYLGLKRFLYSSLRALKVTLGFKVTLNPKP